MILYLYLYTMPSQIKNFPKPEICRIFKKWEKPSGFTDILDPQLIELFCDEHLSDKWNIIGTYKNFIIEYPLSIGKKIQIHSEKEFIEYLIDIFKEKFTKEELKQFDLELEEKANPINICANLRAINKDLHTQKLHLEKQLKLTDQNSMDKINELEQLLIQRDKDIAKLNLEKDKMYCEWKHEVTSLKNSHQLDIDRYQREEKKSEYIIKMLEDKNKSLEIEAQINLDF